MKRCDQMITEAEYLLTVSAIILSIFTGIAPASPTITANESSFHQEYDPNQILVQFHDDVAWEDKINLISSLQCHLMDHSLYIGCMRVMIDPQSNLEDMIAAFESHSEMVAYAEKESLVRGFLIPNDPFYNFQWHFNDQAGANINIEEAWEMETGDPCVVIAVIDTGIAYENFDIFAQAPDLANTRFVAGYDFVNNDTHPNDDNGHGTHVTGTISQSTNNGLGVAGVAFDCSVMPVKSLGANNGGSVFDVADGVIFAALNGAKVINMSLGGRGDSITLRNACQMAHEMGVTIVCAAGNEFNDGNPMIYPAAYDEFCIAVGAVRYDKSRANYSSVGTYVDIAAPGGDLAVDQNGDGFGDGVLQQTFSQFDVTDFSYYFFQGTSMAAPHVAGVAGLLYSKGVTDPQKIRLAIEKTAQDLGPPGTDPEYGAGLLNAGEALVFSIQGDLTGDLIVDLRDLKLFSDFWLVSGQNMADLDGNEFVDLKDFNIFAANWAPMLDK